METLQFNITINASKEVIWEILWNDETYKKWTGVFCEGSSVKTSWNEGDKIYFLSPNGEGMNSIIEVKIPYEYIAFKHIGELKNFEEIPINDAVKEWSGAMETYRLIPKENSIDLEVKIDVIEKYVDYFKESFPKGLEVVKQLSEEK